MWKFKITLCFVQQGDVGSCSREKTQRVWLWFRNRRREQQQTVKQVQLRQTNRHPHCWQTNRGRGLYSHPHVTYLNICQDYLVIILKVSVTASSFSCFTSNVSKLNKELWFSFYNLESGDQYIELGFHKPSHLTQTSHDTCERDPEIWPSSVAQT